ncbi:D-alanyl-D-alanine carboxypeptidase/D-alanyl-D-alanine endopeptidase [Haliangium sp.]|uniref:D-alanyl-D-alanine carboxypeptidase/D-alanyl-D-alanine endopeptidase n=1 Tax=Haliangium sp. TaxID=2663208 RepID=UPI003D0AB5C8
MPAQADSAPANDLAHDSDIAAGPARLTPAGLPPELIAELERLRTSSPLDRSTTAIYVVDANTGEPLFAVNQDEPLNPASNVKLISTATALDQLGPDWRYVTRLLGPIPNDAGVVPGDLYLAGNADPTLDTDDLEELAAALAARGVSHVAGDLVVGPGALRDSLGLPRLHIHVRGTRPGRAPEVTVEPSGEDDNGAALVEVEVKAETIRRRRGPRLQATVTLVDDPIPHYRVELSGTISARRSKHLRRRIPAPQLFTARLLGAALARAGITVAGTVRRAELLDHVVDNALAGAVPIELARHESRPLSDIIARINKRSLNRLADRVLMTAGTARYGGAPTMSKGVRAMHEWLRGRAGVDPEALFLDTGSGLSYRTQLTARQIVSVVQAAAGLAHAPPDADPAVFARAARRPRKGRTDAPGPVLSERRADDDPDELTARRFGPEAGDGPSAGGDDGRDDDSGEDDDHGDDDPALSDPAQEDATRSPSDDVGLARGADDAEAEAFMASLAVGGVDGTLRGRLRDLRGQVFAKTGTLTEVIALSGIVTAGDEALAFAIVSNGHRHRRRRQVRRQHDAIVKALHRYLNARAAADE